MSIETRNEEAGYVEFINSDVPYIVRDLPASAAILLDMETRQVIGYRVYEHPTPSSKVVPCPCTLIEQDEDCPIGYPSLICGICKGIGNTTPEQVTALACETIKIASDIGEPEDPFAAWESVSLVQSQRDRLLNEARDVIACASDTYKKRNGHRGSFEDNTGEKCWIVPFDAFEGLRAAVAALYATATEGER